MTSNARVIGLVGLILMICGVAGLIVVSPEPVKIIERSDGMLTAIPRIPWATGVAELAVVIGAGLVVASVFMRWKAKRQ
jgi:hypothetical protein